MSTTPVNVIEDAPPQTRKLTLQRFAVIYARLALGTAFLSAVAARFGIWHGQFDLQRFGRFISRTGEVNAFMPAFTIPFLAWTATTAEVSIGILLILGLWPRWVAFAAAILLGLFATSMTISLGIKAPLDSSVFSASAGALLLALLSPRQSQEP